MKKIFIVLFVISIIVNIYYTCYVLGKGITLNNYNTYHQEQYQQQWQGVLSINQWVSQGNQIEWRILTCSYNDITSELNKLHPISALYSKIIFYKNLSGVDIIYPDIFIEKK